MGAILPLLGSLAGRIIGTHHLSNATAPIQSFAEGVGLRFIAGFVVAGYIFSPAFHEGLSGLIRVTYQATKAAVGL